MAKERLFLIDGSALAYRSFFALIRSPLTNSRGMNTSAAFGFVNELIRLLDNDKPERLAVVFDPPGPTFRHEKFEDYKATREKMPDEMGWQLPYIDKLVDALGVSRLQIPGFEADDVIGTLARRGEEAGLDVIMVTGDKDFMQLVTDRVRIRNPWSGDPSRLMGPKEVEGKLGVPPERVRDLLALMGDSSDNIPGVPGIGPKTAQTLMAQFGSLQAALDGFAEVKAKRARENLEKHREDALLSYELVTIDTDVPLEVELDDLTVGEPDRAALVELFTELEFTDHMRRFSSEVKTDGQRYHVVQPDDADGIASLVSLLESADEVAFCVDATGEDPHRAGLAGIGFAISAGESFYVPAHPDAAPEDADPTFSARFAPAAEQLLPLIVEQRVPAGGHETKAGLILLDRHGVPVFDVGFDSQIEAHLIDPGLRNYTVNELAVRYLGYKKRTRGEAPGRNEQQATFATLALDEIADRCCEDTDLALRLHRSMAGKMAEHEGLLREYREVELPLIGVLARMERAGVAVDVALLGRLSEEFDERAKALQAEAWEIAGEEFNLGSPKQLSQILFEKMKIHEGGKRPRRTKTGAYSTDEASLEAYAEVPIVAKLFEHRALLKLKGTYVDALPALVNPITGRIHTSYNQAGAATGRLASNNPNLQNIPIRTAEGRRIREAFIAAPGNVLLSADYSQIELRLLAHFSEEESLIEAFTSGQDIHRATAARVFGVAPEEVTAELRSRSKAINYGIIYGMGATRLARDTGLSLKEAREFIATYFEKHPKVEAWSEAQVEAARANGWVETILGRRRLLPEIYGNNPMVRSNAERVAKNTPLQGSAADLIKVAMIRIDAALRGGAVAGARMLLQVHDELLFECPEDAVDDLTDLVRRDMEGAIELRVPLRVDVGWGPTWLDAH